MIEIIVKNYLDSVLQVPVKTEREDDPPRKYVLIERTGESVSNLVRTATIAIQAYAGTRMQGGSMYEAAELMEEVIAAMDGLRTVDEVSGVYLNTSYNYTDPSTKVYRYQAVYQITYY